MKKFYTLLSCFLLIVCAGLLQAQTWPWQNPEIDPEKIYFFDVDIQVQANGQIIVTENITLNAKHQKINRGIYRDIPISLTEQAEPISLTMDGETHPFFTERNGKFLRVNFGNDNYINKGVHTYRFTYSYIGAINFLKHYDELYWNVTGNGWDFVIDSARAHVSFPDEVEVKPSGISLYTGKMHEKHHNAREVAPLTFQTTTSLRPQEGFTIAIPFNKGAIEEPTLAQRMEGIFSLPLLLSSCLFIFLLGYFILTWLQVGKDPVYLALTQYEPPQGISPAFMYYLENEVVNAQLLTCAILDMAMKGLIEVKKTDSFFSKTQLVLKNKDIQNLPYEEKLVCEILFSHFDTLTLDNTAASQFEKLNKSILKMFKEQVKQYIVSNSSYLIKGVLLTLGLGVIPFLLTKNYPLIFINLHFAAFFLTFTLMSHRIITKIGFGFVFTLFYGVFWIAAGESMGLDSAICQFFYVAGMWALTFYGTLIRNVTPQGKTLFELITGFKKYMKTAEIHRVSASEPLEPEKIFCAYLPFAFALGMSNQWIKKFSHILSQATIDKCMTRVGGIHNLSGGLSRSISSAMPSGSGGSHGGGCSGGGHGGGGGGGR